MPRLQNASRSELLALEKEALDTYRELGDKKLQLNLARGKPGLAQSELSASLDGILDGDYRSETGTDTRSYCPPAEGLPEARRLFAEILQVREEECFVGDTSSLRLMYFNILFAWLYGLGGAKPWQQQPKVRFLCPVPGYDRHFSICETLGIEMLPVPITPQGPDMQQVEEAVRDPATKGIFCVPRFSNPCGTVYSPETVQAIARLGQFSAPDFRIFWDNAYTLHEFEEGAPDVPPLMELCREQGTEGHALLFASCSKITFAGAGVCALGTAPSNLQEFIRHLADTQVATDKVNQLRHVRFLRDMENLRRHMRAHADIVRPKFHAILERLRADLADFGDWSKPQGGYFILFRTRPGLAREVVRLAADIGLQLTSAGATWPLGKDPEDRDIRIAPTSAPSEQALADALDVFVSCVRLATARQLLQEPRQNAAD